MSDTRDYIVANGEFRELIKQVAILSTKVDNFDRRLDDLPKSDVATCAVHSQQIRSAEARLLRVEETQDKIKDIIGRRNVIAGAISAGSTGIMYLIMRAMGR